MKKIVLAVLIFLLLLTPTFPSIPKVSATTTEDLWTTPALPEDIPREPTSDSPSGDYLNTTNPYADITGIPEAWDEFDEAEGDQPLYVLVFADEEEREVIRRAPSTVDFIFLTWVGWALAQLERGDEALVANFGIDIRILGFLEWDSDDNLDTMTQLWYELESDTEQYLRRWYNGEAWSDYVDAIIGITSQVDPYPHAGKAPPPEYLDQGRIFTLLNWQVYWADDNLVQHEVSHLFYAPDHPEHQNEPCCAMASHKHFVWYTWEDGLWWVLNDVPCAYTSHDWCGDCYGVIDQKKSRYSVNLPPLTPSTPSGSTSGYINEWYTYSTSTTDPNGDDVCYEFEFSGPIPTVSFTTGWYASGETGSITVMWETSDPLGTYYVRARAQDGYGEWSGWSSSLTVSISSRDYYSLTINVGMGGTTTPSEGTYEYAVGTSVTVTAYAGYSYTFLHWSLDGTIVYANPITVTMDSDHTLYAQFQGGGGGCPILSVFDGSDYVTEGLLDIHNPDGIDLVYNHTLITEPAWTIGAYQLRLTEHPQTHSYIDQVKLYATLKDGTEIELPLIHAWHSEHGNVLPQLLFSDEWKTDTLGADRNNGTSQSIDLRFSGLPRNLSVVSFVFQIEGNNVCYKR